MEELFKELAKQIPSLVALILLVFFGIKASRETIASFQNRMLERDNQIEKFAETLKSVNMQVLEVIRENSTALGQNSQILATVHREMHRNEK